MKNFRPSRKRAFLTQLTGGYILTVIAIVKGLLLLPIYFKFISHEMYGYWITIGSIVALLSIINFGIGTMVTQRISTAYAQKDFKAVGDYFINSLMIYIVISLVFIGSGLILSYWLRNILNISSEQLKLLKTAFDIALLTMVFSFFADAFRGFAAALLKPLFGVYVMVGANLFGIGLVLFFLYNNFGLLSLPISLFVVEAIVVVLCGLYVLRLYTQFGLNPKINISILKEYFTFSPYLFKLSIGSKLLEQSHPVIITSFLGAEITTAYDVTRKVIGIILRILNIINAALIAPFSHLVGEGDTTIIKQTTMKIILLSFLMGIIGYGTYITTNGMFVNLWIGQDIVLSQNVIILLGLSAFMFSMNRLFRSLLFGFDELKFATNSVLLEGVAYVVLSSIFIGIFGIITIPFVFFIVSSFFTVILFKKIMELANIKLNMNKIINIFLMTIFISLLVLVISNNIETQNWNIFIFNIILSIVSISIIIFLFQYKYLKEYNVFQTK